MGNVLSALIGDSNEAATGDSSTIAASFHHGSVVTLSSLMERYKLTESACKKEIGDEFFESISHSFCDNWRRLPGYLRVRNVVDEIEDKRKDEWLRKIAFFRFWRQSRGPDATYEVLIGALLKIGCVDDAHSVCKLLQDISSQQPVSAPTGVSSEQFPYLPIENLQDTEIEDLRAKLIEDGGKLDRQFTSLVHKTLEFLERNNKTVRELRDLVKTSRYLQSLLDLFQEAETLDIRELFVDKLDGYWSFFDYELIELFVQHFGDAALKDLMDKYQTAFNQYCRRKLHEVPTIKTKSGMKGYILRVKIPQKFHAITVNDIKAVQIQLQKLFGQKIYLEGTQDSCVLLVFVSFIKILSLTSEQVHQLRDMGVLNVSTRYCVLYDHANDKNIETLRSSTVMVLEPPASDVINGIIQLHYLPKWKNWTEAELYLTQTSLCYKIQGIGVCKMGLEGLLDIQVNRAIMMSCQKAYKIDIGVSFPPSTIPVVLHSNDDASDNLQAATEWKNAIFNQAKKKVFRQQKEWPPVKIIHWKLPCGICILATVLAVILFCLFNSPPCPLDPLDAVFSIQPGPPLLILTYGSNATYECQAQPDLKKFERIKWNITVGGQKYFEVPDIPLCYGIEYNHRDADRYISLKIPIRQDKVNTTTTVLCTVILTNGDQTNSIALQITVQDETNTPIVLIGTIFLLLITLNTLILIYFTAIKCQKQKTRETSDTPIHDQLPNTSQKQVAPILPALEQQAPTNFFTVDLIFFNFYHHFHYYYC